MKYAALGVALAIAAAISAAFATGSTQTTGAWWWVFTAWMLALIVTGAVIQSFHNAVLRGSTDRIPFWFAGLLLVVALWLAGTASFNGF